MHQHLKLLSPLDAPLALDERKLMKGKSPSSLSNGSASMSPSSRRQGNSP